MAHKKLETERLILRSLTPEDYRDAFVWCSDPIVNRYMAYPLYHHAEDVKKWLETLDPNDPNSYDYGIVQKNSGILIGSAEMSIADSGKGAWSIGYNLRFDMWGKGYTTEAMRAIIAHVCSKRDVRVIEANHAIDNPASGRVMEKLGLKFDRYGEYAKLDGSATFKAKIYRMEL